ncbi:MAG TPA: hypothetical protein PKL04_00975 [Methanofastidiosum sp.]|nr:hypothetical protein [Methanofastidiosum sp.]
MRKKYILFFNDLTQIAILVDDKNNFSLKSLEQIINDDTTKYKPVTKEHRYTLYCQFIKDNPDSSLIVDETGSIYKRLYDLSSEVDPIIFQRLLSLKLRTK